MTAKRLWGKKKKTLLTKEPGTFEHIIDLKEVYSFECFLDEDGTARSVLAGINLNVRKGEIWALTGPSGYAIGLLLTIIGNITSYHTGEVLVTEKELPRRKRIILPDVFYIGTSEMLYEDMNVLEFISFATQKAKMLNHLNAPASQKAILDFLIAADLSYISLSRVAHLSQEERLLITLICAYYAGNSLVIINQARLSLNKRLSNSFAYILREMQKQEQTSIFTSKENYALIDDLATHIGVLYQGQMIYSGSTDAFRRQYDRVAFELTARHPHFVQEILVDLLPDYIVTLEGSTVVIRDKFPNEAPDDMEVQYLYAQIREAELWVEQVHINEKSTKNAVKEVISEYDLSLQQL